MNRSTGGERVSSGELRPFEGLVRQTSRMFASQVGWEEEDMAQELRVKVWRAVVTYDSSRGLSLERHVFGAVSNRVKDFKRDAAREVNRRRRNGISFLHIEGMRMGWLDDSPINPESQQEAFDSRFHFVDREEVYGRIEEGKFVVPAGVTAQELTVLLLLMMEVSKTEIALRLGLTKAAVYDCIVSLRAKFADWAPTQEHPNSSRTVDLSTVQTVRAEDQLVGSRAA